ncbi:MAG: hypothetical protein H0V84_02405 [Actinobacteria bacterium]|nr:hypothetical protein [Actinomycetota bacterium]
MSTSVVVLAWVGLTLGLVVAVAVVALFSRVVQPALEIARYADDILEHGVAIATNLDGVDEAVRTRELATSVPPLAVSYLKKLGLA